MRRTSTVLLSAACALLAAGESAPTPLLDLRVADGTTLEQHATASIYGRLWLDPVAAKLRTALDGALAEERTAAEQAGKPWIDPFALIHATKDARLVVHGFTGDRASPVRLTMQADVGAMAGPLMAFIRHQGSDASVDKADEAAQTTDGKLTIARFGTCIVASTRGTPTTPLPKAAAPVHDLTMAISVTRLIADLQTTASVETNQRDRATWAALLPLLGQLGTTITAHADLVATGVDTHATWDMRAAWLLPVDQRLMGRIDGKPLLVNAVGIDGARLWRDVAPSVLAAIAATEGIEPAAVAAKADAAIAALGVDARLEALVSELRGTILVTVANAAPFPTVTVSVPTGPKLDALIAVAFTANGQQAPAIGESVPVMLGQLPLSVTAMREDGRWTITSDPVLPSTWPAGKPAGFADSPFLARIAASPDPVVSAATTDMPALLRLAQGYVSMIMGFAQMKDPTITQSTLMALNKAAAMAAPSWQLVTRSSTGLTLDEHLMLPPYDNLGLTSMPIIAAIAIPNLLESRVSANEAAAAATLKSSIHVAQVVFQAGSYMDQDSDNRGEYGTINELTGLCPVGLNGRGVANVPGAHQATSLTLLPSSFDNGGPVNGYRYIIYVSDGQGGAISENTPADGVRTVLAACNDQEKYFIAYAWPEQFGDSGRRTFAITQDGRVLASPLRDLGGGPPAWNACLVDGTTMNQRQVAWPVYAR